MWLQAVDVRLERAAKRPLVLKISVGNVKQSQAFPERSAALRYAFKPTLEVAEGESIIVHVDQTSKWRPDSRFGGATFHFDEALKTIGSTECTYREPGKFTARLELIAGRESLLELAAVAQDLTSTLTSTLGRLGEWKKTVEGVLSLGTIAAELNPISKAVVAFVNMAYKHLQTQDECDAKVKSLAEGLPTMLDFIDPMKPIIDSEALERAISNIEQLIRESTAFIVNYCKRRAGSRALRSVLSSADQDTMQELKKRLDGLKHYFHVAVTIKTARDTHAIREHLQRGVPLTGSTADFLTKPVLPAKPDIMLGRDTELEGVVRQLVQDDRPRITILGPGGMGKTTLALRALHDAHVIERFGTDRRYFVGCEGAANDQLFLTELANALRIPPGERESVSLGDLVRTKLRGSRAVLCADNFETPWEDLQTRDAVEALLASLAEIPTLAIVVTMRGTQRPGKVRWATFPRQLGPLSFEDGRALYADIAGRSADEHIDSLLYELECIPLAVTLLGYLSRDDEETSEALRARWKRQGGALFETGEHRLSSLDASISLSVYSPRMRACPHAATILALLAVLPDGMSTAIEEFLRASLQDDDFDKPISTLKRVALLQESRTEGTNETRLAMLSPIRLWVSSNLHAEHKQLHALYKAYTDLLIQHTGRSNMADYRMVTPELINSRHVLLRAYHDEPDLPGLTEASISLTSWSLYQGILSEDVILTALQHESRANAHGDCFAELGNLQAYKNKLKSAEESYTCAIEFYKQGQDIFGEAKSLHGLGGLYDCTNRLQKAEESYMRAIELFKQAHNILGEANSLCGLGFLYGRTDRLQKADDSYTHAIELFKQVQNIFGEANSLRGLGDLYGRTDHLQEAEESYTSAIELSKQAQDVLGEANSLRGLGDLYCRTDLLQKAEESYMSAIELSKQAQSVLVEADSLRGLGYLYHRTDRLQKAEESYKRAIELGKQAQDVLGEARSIEGLGRICIANQQYGDGEQRLLQALQLYVRISDTIGQGNTMATLAKLHLAQERLEDADSYLHEAINLYRQAGNTLGEGNGWFYIGKLRKRQGRLDDARQSFGRAAELYEKSHVSSGVASCARQLELLAEISSRSFDTVSGDELSMSGEEGDDAETWSLVSSVRSTESSTHSQG